VRTGVPASGCQKSAAGSASADGADGSRDGMRKRAAVGQRPKDTVCCRPERPRRTDAHSEATLAYAQCLPNAGGPGVMSSVL
jgi:hypothetical protein